MSTARTDGWAPAAKAASNTSPAERRPAGAGQAGGEGPVEDVEVDVDVDGVAPPGEDVEQVGRRPPVGRGRGR